MEGVSAGGQLGDLGAAAEAVGEDDGIRASGAQFGEEYAFAAATETS
jgi:hypothetical protein